MPENMYYRYICLTCGDSVYRRKDFGYSQKEAKKVHFTFTSHYVTHTFAS